MLMEKMKEMSVAIQPAFGYGGGVGLNILQLFQELISPVNDIEIPELLEPDEPDIQYPDLVPEVQAPPPPPQPQPVPLPSPLPPHMAAALPALHQDPFLSPPPSSPPPQPQIFSLNAVPVPLTSSPTSFIYFTDTGAAMSWEIVDESQINNQNLPNIEIIFPDPASVHNDSGFPDSPIPPEQNSSH